jgi:hypothetical protein
MFRNILFIIFSFVFLIFASVFSKSVTLSFGTGTGKLGSEDNRVGIHLENDVAVRGIMFSITDTPDFLKADSIYLTDRTKDFILDYEATKTKDDTLKIILLSFTNEAIDPGVGKILEIRYSVKENANIDQQITLEILKDVQVNALGLGEDETLDVYVNNGNFIITEIQNRGSIPFEYALNQNYPNPFNPSTTIPFSIKKSGVVKLDVINMLGQHVCSIVDEFYQPGHFTAKWMGKNSNGQDVPAGIYFYRLEINGYIKAKPLILLW